MTDQQSQFIFNDSSIKSRLILKDTDWYVAEWKETQDTNAQWTPWICGTSQFLGLSNQEKEWAKP